MKMMKNIVAGSSFSGFDAVFKIPLSVLAGYDPLENKVAGLLFQAQQKTHKRIRFNCSMQVASCVHLRCQAIKGFFI